MSLAHQIVAAPPAFVRIRDCATGAGTLAEFAAAFPDRHDREDVAAALAVEGVARVGGGAAPAFEVTAAASRPPVPARATLPPAATRPVTDEEIVRAIAVAMREVEASGRVPERAAILAHLDRERAGITGAMLDRLVERAADLARDFEAGRA